MIRLGKLSEQLNVISSIDTRRLPTGRLLLHNDRFSIIVVFSPLGQKNPLGSTDGFRLVHEDSSLVKMAFSKGSGHHRRVSFSNRRAGAICNEALVSHCYRVTDFS